MKKNLRGKIREYIQSEEGKVGVKTPLSLGVVAGGLLLAHAIVGTSQAEAGWCVIGPNGENPCPEGYTCRGPWIWDGMREVGTCTPDC